MYAFQFSKKQMSTLGAEGHVRTEGEVKCNVVCLVVNAEEVEIPDERVFQKMKALVRLAANMGMWHGDYRTFQR